MLNKRVIKQGKIGLRDLIPTWTLPYGHPDKLIQITSLLEIPGGFRASQSRIRFPRSHEDSVLTNTTSQIILTGHPMPCLATLNDKKKLASDEHATSLIIIALRLTNF